ncbi:MAG: TSUP family transporter [Burkholderiaceae bacterium]
MTLYFTLCAAALLAGMVDAVVGGGGLIQIPALFTGFPAAPPAALLGTSKIAGVWGTAFAAVSYSRRVRVEWTTAVPAAVAAFIFSFTGAFAVTRVPPDLLRQLLPFILLAVALYTYKRKNFGTWHAPTHTGMREKLAAIVAGGAIGFYDGFFGPGTGSFLVFVFVRFFGFDFLSASAVAKVVNVSCNVAAILWFGPSGNVLWQVGLMMAVCNILGALIGTRLAIRQGSGFIRKVFLVVVGLLIVKTSFDAFLK